MYQTVSYSLEYFLLNKKFFLTDELSLINTCLWRADQKILIHDSEAGVYKYSHLPGLKSQIIAIFVKPTCSERVLVELASSERDIALTVSVWCMCMPAWVVLPSRFVQAIPCTFMPGFQNSLAQLLSSCNRSAIWNICSGMLKIKADDKIDINRACLGHNFYICAWISK